MEHDCPATCVAARMADDKEKKYLKTDAANKEGVIGFGLNSKWLK